MTYDYTALVKRLRERKAFGKYHAKWMILPDLDRDCQKAADAIEALSADLAKATATIAQMDAEGDFAAELNACGERLTETEAALTAAKALLKPFTKDIPKNMFNQDIREEYWFKRGDIIAAARWLEKHP